MTFFVCFIFDIVYSKNMDAEIAIPLVVSEDAEIREARMFLVITIIVIVMLLWVSHMNCSRIPDRIGEQTIISQDIPNSIEQLYLKTGNETFISAIEHENSPVDVKTILLTNLNKRKIPVNKIVVKDNMGRMHIINKSSNMPYGDDGVQMIFTLPEQLKVQEIIIDVNQLCPYKSNIHTTQVDVVNQDKKITWKHGKNLPINHRYIYLDIVKPVIVYPEMQDILCEKENETSTCSQENKLNKHLQLNVW